MTKTAVQWKIFYDSMNSKKINLIDLGLFIINSMLQIFQAALNLTRGRSPYNWILGSFWMVGAFLFFLRLFYNQASLRFCKTLPCTKKLYTRYIWICFEGVNTIVIIEWIVLWIVYSLTGKDVTMFGIMFLLSCIVHLILSVVMPFTVFTLSQETQINAYSGVQKTGATLKLLLYIFMMCGGFAGIYMISKVVINNLMGMTLLGNSMIICACLCILGISCFLNKIMFNKLYEKIR